MLRLILLVAAVLGLATPALAAQPSLFDEMFKKPAFSKASLNVGVPRKIDGPIQITVDLTTQEMDVVADGRTIYTFDVGFIPPQGDSATTTTAPSSTEPTSTTLAP